MNVLFPATVEAALEALCAEPDAHVMAGGTDLLVRCRAEQNRPETLVCLEKVADLAGFEISDGRIRIGAATSMTAVLENAAVRERLPLLHGAAKVFASPLVRNMATLGGNVCTASPAADMLPPLYALGAEVELRSLSGVRTMPVNDFIVGPGQMALAPGELLSAIIIPIPEGRTIQYFEKVGRRKALAISVVSLAALLRVEDGVIAEARLAWGSVGPMVIRCPEAEALLKGRSLTLGALREAGEKVRDTVSPISDVRASAEYRRQVAANLLLRLAQISGAH
ncbi:xanthine dehydrogenase family protein subunit M [Pseudodesulfovibrio cashew]|uniref:Xanthine dehydrogenase family protein subunit M n=1 Tax=Pseudodesulfovibrio cashew TaxID=2678688 RepID=A0A6I6JNZ7_9BACT|nr:xanthine dehydrogenase family protein subunit M [Pseudodesulfovibrio cashew]QGY41867.1 xanthine dehydrogenase family protein subunit M [Pseudodesulfovibrio cashew]